MKIHKTKNLQIAEHFQCKIGGPFRLCELNFKQKQASISSDLAKTNPKLFYNAHKKERFANQKPFFADFLEKNPQNIFCKSF